MPQDRVEQLVQAGLDFYGIGQKDNAARCWREALAQQPGHKLAAEYLSLLTGEFEPATSPGLPTVASPASGVRAVEQRDPELSDLRMVVDSMGRAGANRAMDKDRLIGLLRDRRYEEALQVLYRLRDVSPDNASVSRAIQLLMEKLQAQYLAQLGSLDQVPERIAGGQAPSGLTDEEQAVLRLVDGIATTTDVLESCRLARLQAVRALTSLIARDAVRLVAPRASGPRLAVPAAVAAPSPAQASAPTPQARTPAPPVSGDSVYDPLFRRATEAYLRRDYEAALRLFEECRKLRPSDSRVLHNIERLLQRRGG